MLKEVKRVFKDTVIYGLGSLLPKAAGIILVPIYTRFLSTTDYGVYSLATMIASMVGVVMLLGQGGSITLHMRRRLADEGDTRELLFTVTVFVLFFGALLLSVLWALGPVLTPLVSDDGAFQFSPHVQLALAIAFLGLPLALQQAVNRARGQARLHTTFQLTQFALNTTITLYYVVVLRQGAVGSLKGTLFATALVAPVALWLLWREMRPRFSVTWLRSSLRFGLPLVPHYLSGWLLTFADRALIGRLAGLSAVGLYSVAYNLSMVLNLFSTAINQAWGPVYYDLSDTEEGRRILPRLTTVYASAIAAIAIGFTLLGPQVLRLLAARSFWEAAPVVPMVAAGYFFFAMYMVLSTPIFYARKTWWVPLVSGTAAVINIILNLWLIPALGIMGAAVATLVAYMLMALAARVVSSRLRPGAFEDGRLVRVVLIYFAALATSYGIEALDLPLVLAIAAKAAAAVPLLALFVVTGVATRKEFAALWERVRKRRSGKAAKPEVEAARDAESSGASPDASGFSPDDRQ